MYTLVTKRFLSSFSVLLALLTYSSHIKDTSAFSIIIDSRTRHQLASSWKPLSAANQEVGSPTTTTTTTKTTTNNNNLPQEKYLATMPDLSVKHSTKAGLQDKTVFLTGASGGLGSALARQLAECGVGNLILSARKLDALQELLAECQKINANVKVHTLACDLGNAAQVKATAAKALAEIGDGTTTIDVLINNGGVSSRSAFLDTDLSVDEKVMQINFLAGAAFCKAFIPGMVAQKQGKVIWISSVQGLMGIPNRSSYAASKFAVQGYTESMRAELKSRGVTVHTVSPGYIRTNLSNSAMTGDGTAYGKTDETTAAGADPTQVAVDILDRVVTSGQEDFTIAATFSAVVAIYLRTLCPGLLRSLLVSRYEKSVRKEKSD